MNKSFSLNSLLERTRGWYIIIITGVVQLLAFPGVILGTTQIQWTSEYGSALTKVATYFAPISILFGNLILLGIVWFTTRTSRKQLDLRISGSKHFNTEQELAAWREITVLPWRYGILSALFVLIFEILLPNIYFALRGETNPEELLYSLMGGIVSTIAVSLLSAMIIDRLLMPAQQILTPRESEIQLKGRAGISLNVKLQVVAIGMILVAILSLGPVSYQHTIRALFTDTDPVKVLSDLRLQTITIALMTIFLGVILTFLISRSISNPTHELIKTFQKLEQGDLTQRAAITASDELGDVIIYFNRMIAQVENFQHTLEDHVQERTRELEHRSLELETIAEVARDLTTVRDLDTLLNLAAYLIQERFNYYHVGIFLINDRGEYAILRAASGVAARALLEQRYKLKVGEGGTVGYVANSGIPRIDLEVGIDTVHPHNPLLPETRSEMALPLRSSNITIGVLDIQAIMPSAFSQESIKTLQLLTDQISSAIENAQLVKKVEDSLAELNKAYQSQTRQAWQKNIQEHGQASLEYDGLQIKPVTHKLPVGILQQLETGKAVVLEGNDLTRAERRSQNTLVVPLMVLNQMIGILGIEKEKPNYTWTEEEITMVEAAASRAALALENARLLQDAQRQAAKEQTIVDISAKIGSLVNIDNIIQTTIQELSRTMPDTDVAIQFGTPLKG